MAPLCLSAHRVYDKWNGWRLHETIIDRRADVGVVSEPIRTLKRPRDGALLHWADRERYYTHRRNSYGAY